MLKLAARRLRSGDVHYVEADLFEWQPSEEYDSVFFSFWLSHVPPTRFNEFWDLVARCLAPGGRVFFVDSQHEQSSTAIDHRLPDREHIQLLRRLNDGREFRIYKLFYDVHALQQQLVSLGWNISVGATERYFIYGQGHRVAAQQLMPN
jgi:demethylmenaquinone methyltransferase/2-methoxy-6-polyprenyl-1,4-benzoquinol methylase